MNLSSEAKRLLPEGQIQVTVAEDVSEAVRLKRIVIEVGWMNQAGQHVQPVRLAAWKHAGAGT